MSLSKQSIKLEDEIRCSKCNKLIAKNLHRKLEIKCLRCGSISDVFDDSDEQVVLTDKDGKILFMNTLAEKITGYTLAESFGKRPRQLWASLVSDEVNDELVKKISKDKIPFKTNLEHINKTGQVYKVNLTVSPIKDSLGKIIFYVGIARCIV